MDLRPMIDASWMRTTWSFLVSRKFVVKAPHLSFRCLRSHDCFIMDRINTLPIPKMDKLHINHCRVYLQVVTLSDIVDAGGVNILDTMLRGQRDQSRVSQLNWPNQGRPNESDWAVWRYNITRLFSQPRSRRLSRPLGHWIAQPHQEWTWFFDSTTSSVYHKQHNLYVQYHPDRPDRINTRSGQHWYNRVGIVVGSLQHNLLRCTVKIAARDRILLMNVSRRYDNNPPSFVMLPSPPQRDIDPYYRFRYISDLDDGTVMPQKLEELPSYIVGDGSYERSDDNSAAAFIWESGDTTSRIINATMVPVNRASLFRFWSDPYRCELFSILLALMSVYDMECRFDLQFQPITIAVDNDSALDTALLFDGLVSPTEQHYDIISSIREVRHRLRTTILHSQVKGHRDDDILFYQMTKLEQLNVECDLLAKHARTHMNRHMHLMPSLNLPFERISLYHGENKIYKDFNKIVIDRCYYPRARQYYCRKYTWDDAQFSANNWEAIDGAMTRCTPGTAKWIAKFSSGFIGTAKALARREYWLDRTCPMCRNDTENNTHVICCPHPSQRQLLGRQLDELYEWMDYVRFTPVLLNKIKRINKLWPRDPSLIGVTSPSPAIQNQLQLGWQHLFYGRTHQDITASLHQHYTSLGFRRHTQSTISLFIYKIWTVVVRPIWNSRNRRVHATDAPTSLSRMQQDLRDEISEIYQNTNQDMLFHRDRRLFDTPLDDLLKKHDSYLYSWRDEIDIATKHASSSATSNDPTQQTLNFHINNNFQINNLPRQHEDTRIHVDDMTPVQRRIHRRCQTLPTIHTPHSIPEQQREPPHAPQHPPTPTQPPQNINIAPPPLRPPPQKRCHRQQPRRAPTTTRIPRPVHSERSLPVANNTQNQPNVGTLFQYWSPELERRRLMRGSWRPP